MLTAYKWLAAIGFFVLVLSVIGIAYYSSQPSNNPTYEQAGTEQKTRDNSQEEKVRRTIWQFLFPDAITIFTFWLVVATIILGVVAIIQIGFLNRAEEIAVRSANAAKDAADAAKESADIAKQALVSTQRAFVYSEKIAQHPQVNVVRNTVEGWIFHFPWKNTGTTPALMVKSHVNVWQFAGNMPEWFPFPTMYGGSINEFYIAPNSTRETGPLFIPIEQMQKAFQQEYHTFFFGYAEYVDIFGDNHLTRFCTEMKSIIEGDPSDIKGNVTFSFVDWKRFQLR